MDQLLFGDLLSVKELLEQLIELLIDVLVFISALACALIGILRASIEVIHEHVNLLNALIMLCIGGRNGSFPSRLIDVIVCIVLSPLVIG